MLRRIWQVVIQFWQQLFGGGRSAQTSRTGYRKQAYLSPQGAQKPLEAPKPLQDADREFLFMQLLEGVGHGWQQYRVLKFFTDLEERSTESQWIEWLGFFGERLLASPAPNEELAIRMLQLGSLGCGELGDVATEIGNQLLERGNRQQLGQLIPNNLNFPEADDYETDYDMRVEPQQVTLDQLWQLLQEDTGLAQQMADIFQVNTNDPQSIINALLNQSNAENELTDDPNQFNHHQEEMQATNYSDVIEAEFIQEEGYFSTTIDSNNYPEEERNNQANTFYEQGEQQLLAGDFEAAIANFNQAIEIKAEFYQAWNKQGIALLNLGRLEEAIANFDQAIKIETNFDHAWRNRGIALNYLGRYEEAIANFDRALEIKIDNWETWINRGKAVANSISCDTLLSSLSYIARKHPSLNQRGYEGELATYQQAFQYIQQETHPEGWGKLHQSIGNCYDQKGCLANQHFEYWRKALVEYREALNIFTEEAFPEAHLEVLQDIFKPLLCLGEIAEAEQLQQQGLELLHRLLNKGKNSEFNRKQLALKFIPFHHLTVDLAVKSGQIIPALELAEQTRNRCIDWMIGNGNEDISSLSWVEIKQLLNSTTAIVYWHLSPSAITTFIIRQDSLEPIVLKESNIAEETTFPLRIAELENWLKEWNQKYQEYAGSADKENHPWRQELSASLTHLGNILDISEVIAELDNITKLILIPHQDLHRLPLHYLFPENFTITYLPSAQIGRNLSQEKALDDQISSEDKNKIINAALLTVEAANNEGIARLMDAEIAGTAITQMFNKYCRIADKNATKEKVIAALAGEYNIFHFTGNSSYNFALPSQSALNLSGQDLLTLKDISKLSLEKYQLINIADYETTFTSNQKIITDYISLESGFLRQGASYAITSIWTVPEECRALLMIELYRCIKAEVAPPEALKQALEWLRNITYPELAQYYQNLATQLATSAPGVSEIINSKLSLLRANPDKINSPEYPYAHPYYWAGFKITGK